jgi:hypothetical protein
VLADFSPACLRIVEVVGEVAVLHQPHAALFDLQAEVPAGARCLYIYTLKEGDF